MEKTVQIKKWTQSANRWSALSALVLLLPFSVLAAVGGDVVYGTRADDGTWSSFSDIRGEAGYPGLFDDLSTSAFTGDLHLVGKTLDGRLWHTIRVHGRWRYFLDQVIYIPPHWLPFSDVYAQAGYDASSTNASLDHFIKVSISANSSTGELHVVGVGSSDVYEWTEWRLWHAIRRADGTWSPFSDLTWVARSPDEFSNVSVSVDSTTGELHVVGTTYSDSKLWHAIRRANGTWSYFGAVPAPYPGAVFSSASVSVNSATDELHLAGVTPDGNLWHTVRQANGTWSPFVFLPGQGPGSAVSIAANPSSGELQLVTFQAGYYLWHTIRRADGTWLPYLQVPGFLPGCTLSAIAAALMGPTLNVAIIRLGPDQCPY
jgi:hypothetical protein